VPLCLLFMCLCSGIGDQEGVTVDCLDAKHVFLLYH
jgi:hypothetical protein